MGIDGLGMRNKGAATEHFRLKSLNEAKIFSQMLKALAWRANEHASPCLIAKGFETVEAA